MDRSLTKEEILAEWRMVDAARDHPGNFAPLYERYYRPIWMFIYRRVDDADTAGDLTSEVFLKTLLNLSKLRNQGLPFKAWLFRVASNEVNLHFRNAKAVRAVNLEKADLEQLALAATESKNLGEEETIFTILKEEMEYLSEQDLQLVEMRFFEKIPFSEVAFILGMTESNAKVRLHRILERMGKRIRAKTDRTA